MHCDLLHVARTQRKVRARGEKTSQQQRVTALAQKHARWLLPSVASVPHRFTSRDTVCVTINRAVWALVGILVTFCLGTGTNGMAEYGLERFTTFKGGVPARACCSNLGRCVYRDYGPPPGVLIARVHSQNCEQADSRLHS